jgi:hypothetical protein
VIHEAFVEHYNLRSHRCFIIHTFYFGFAVEYSAG